MKRAGIVVVSVLVLVTVNGALLLLSSPATLWRFKDPGTLDPGDGLFVLFNPFRDRSPERAADQMFRQLRRGDCESTLSFLADEDRTPICPGERAYRLITWTLRDRERSEDTITLHYSVFRLPHSGVPGNAFVTLRRVRGGWKPIEYMCSY